MVRHIGLHRTDHRDVINMLGDVREYLAHLDAALAVFLEFERRLKSRARAALGLQIIHRQRLAVQPCQGRFRIERVHVRRTAVGKDVNDAFRFGRKLRRFWRERRIARNHVCCPGRGRGELWGQNISQPEHPEPHAAAPQKIAPRQEAVLQPRFMVVHSGAMFGRSCILSCF